MSQPPVDDGRQESSDPAALRMILLIACMLGAGLFGLAHPQTAAAQAATSRLWGSTGELFNPAARLPDVSYAGYRNGAAKPPVLPQIIDVTHYGANGKDTLDDADAIQTALDAAWEGAVYVPAGTYFLNRPLRISRSNVVLRGAGPGRTILVPRTPIDALMNVDSGVRDANYGLTAYIEIVGVNAAKYPARASLGGSFITSVTASAKRGERALRVGSTAGLLAGQEIRLRMSNPSDNSFGCYIGGGEVCMSEEDDRSLQQQDVDWVVKVHSIGDDTIQLQRPLRVDVRPNWTPQIWSYAPTIRQSGVEALTLKFPNERYGGHHYERGWHGLWIAFAENCWARNLEILEADRGIEVSYSNRIYIGGVRFADPYRRTVSSSVESEERYGRVTGHYGVSFNHLTQDSLAEKLTIDARYVHTLSLASFANGNVYSSIVTQAAALDHHGAAPYDNLLTDILIQDDASLLFEGGGSYPGAGLGSTFWNLRKQDEGTRDYPAYTSPEKLPVLNIIGFGDWTNKQGLSTGQWIETNVSAPANLYEAQLARRWGSPAPDPDPPPTSGRISATVKLDILDSSHTFNLTVSNLSGSTSSITKAVITVTGLQFDSLPSASGFTVAPADILASNNGAPYTQTATLLFNPALAPNTTQVSVTGDMDPAAAGVEEPSSLNVALTFADGSVLSGRLTQRSAMSWAFTGSR